MIEGARRGLTRRLSAVKLIVCEGDDEERRTNILAVNRARETRASFRGGLPLSLLETHDSRDPVAPIKLEEINFGPKLGSGEFSNVYEIESFSLQNNLEGNNKTDDELVKRLEMQRNQKYRETDNARYALKHLKSEYFQEHDSDHYIQAASDLALEAEFLASLNHPHIIKLRGLPFNGTSGFQSGPTGYFLIIDRLLETLTDRIQCWKKSSIKKSKFSALRQSITLGGSKTAPTRRGSMFPVMKKKIDKKDLSKSASLPSPSRTKQDERLDERLGVALEIASALKYLHAHNIIYRDLKPANIGFDVRGDVKIFDFGLARVMPDDGCPYTDKFMMSGAGSPRYMSPECLVLGESSYNMKADIYSFAIILWEMLSASQPYSFVRSRDQLVRHVVHKNARPKICEDWPEGIKGMLESSFDKDMQKRPKAALFCDIIRDELKRLRNGNGQGLNDAWILRRRSDASLRRLLSPSCQQLLKSYEEEDEDEDDDINLCPRVEQQEVIYSSLSEDSESSDP